MIWDILPRTLSHSMLPLSFRPFETEGARKEFKAYCLFMIRETYVKYCEYFTQYCKEDCKPEYQNIPGLAEDFCLTSSSRVYRLCCKCNAWSYCTKVYPYPDYDDIDDYVQRHNAKVCFSIILNREMLVKWESYNSIDEFIQDILTIEEIYCRNIKDLKL